MRGIAIREELTDSPRWMFTIPRGKWEKRKIKEQREYAILTAEISKAAFGMTPSEYKKYKNLKIENLRDHMTDLELIFSMLGEASTTEITRSKDSQGFNENLQSAKDGGKIAGDARKKLEKKSGRKVTSKQNYLEKPQNEKLIDR